MRHFGANFRKFWKIDPSKYHVFEKKGPIDVPGGLILLPMFAAHPYNHFCTEYPPGTYTNAKFIVICEPRTLNDGGEDSVKYRNLKKHRFLAAAILPFIGKIIMTW